MSDDLNDGAKRLISGGADIIGSVVGATVGLAVAGPPGVLAGAAVGPSLAWGINEFGERLLGPRQAAKVGATYVLAVEYLAELRGRGTYLRDDGFFQRQPDGTMPSHEAIEGVLLAAQNEPSERKLQFYARLLAHIAVDETLTPQLAAWLIKTAQELTWRQYIILALFERKDTFVIPAVDMHQGALDGWQRWGLTEEWQELGYGRRSLISAGRGAPKGRVAFEPVLGDADKFQLSRGGLFLAGSLGLTDMPASDVESVLDDLRAIEAYRTLNPTTS